MSEDLKKVLEALANEAKPTKASLEGNVEKAIEQKHAMKALQELPAFLTYQKLLAAQIDYRLEELTKSRPGLDDAIRNTHSIGEIAGIKLALHFPEALIGEADDAIAVNRHLLEQGLYTEEEDE